MVAARTTARTYGASGILRRARYEVEKRSGYLRRIEGRSEPGQAWPEFTFSPRVDLEGVRRWLAERPDSVEVAERAEKVAEALLAGRFALYGGRAWNVGWPPAWHRDPQTMTQLSSSAHWSTISEAPAPGDVKDVWELSRMSWIGVLLRAFAVTDDDRWVEAFWTAVLDWRHWNPPFLGPNWMSGQEAALRDLSMLLGLAAFGDHPLSTPERWAALGGIMRDSVGRVASTIHYARSQRNNHAISEATFLWTIAAASPSLPDVDRVRRLASATLHEAVTDQFGLDGSYAQHSFTYQRLAMHALLWTLWIGRQLGVRPAIDIEAPVRRSAVLLASVADPRSGWLPNTGSNDGALLFRLADAHVRDFRPLLTHAAAAVGAPIAVDPGPWDEEAVWFGLLPQSRLQSAPSHQCGPTAYHVLRGGCSHAMLRAGPLRHRPAQDDQLHFDLWIGGINVARDPGTFRYNAAPPWRNALAGADVHNLPRALSVEGAHRLGRFLWLAWPEATTMFERHAEGYDVVVVELRPPGVVDARLRRLVVRVHDSYAVLDEVSPLPGVVRWNLPPETVLTVRGAEAIVAGAGYTGRFSGGDEIRQVVVTDDDPTSGWDSETYGERVAIVALIVPTDDVGRAAATFAQTEAALLPPNLVDAWQQVLFVSGDETIDRAARASMEFLTATS